MKHQNQFITAAPDVKLHVADTGTGRPVIFIHGWPFSDDIFWSQYEALTAAGYRAIGITLRGFGDSDKPETGYDFDTYAADVEAVISSLKLEDAVLAGYSMGGAVAVQYLANHPENPVSQLVLFSSNVPSIIEKADYPYGFPPEDFSGVIEMSRNDRSTLTDVYGPLFSLNENLMPLQEGQRLNRIAAQASPKAVTDSLLAMLEADQRACLPMISISTLILHARNDNAISLDIARQAHHGLSRSELVIFEEGGHWIFLRETEKFNRELLRFLNAYRYDAAVAQNSLV